ncbi:MAG: dihydropyrimidinase [Paracoccaceae bacterium]|jgi:dihydropyrimidinase
MTESFDLIIRNARIVTPSGVVVGDLATLDGQIAAIGQFAGTAVQEIDAAGRYVMPGGVDPHCHIEQMSGMGVWNADTFETATKSAAMGGTTSVISFAAQQQGEPLRQTIANYAARAARGAMIDHAFHITVTDVAVPEFDRDLADLICAGHRSIKVFTTYNIKLSDRAILDLMVQARRSGALVCVHAENDDLIGWTRDGLIAAGLTAPHYHPVSHPRMAEIDSVERMIRYAEFLDQPVMLFHISTTEAVDAIARARGRGVPVWAETCPHYLFMTGDVIEQGAPEGGKWMCSPPQRTTDDQTALWAALAAGDLQVVSSDHAPYRYDETGKLSNGPDAGFHQIANGLPGLETRLPLLFDAMVANDGLGPMAFAQMTASAPAALYGLANKGQIVRGMDADLVIWDDTRSTTFSENDLHDNVGYNPWVGRTITGWPSHVFLRGQLLVENGNFYGIPGSGRWIDRPQIGTPKTGKPALEAAVLLDRS